jgi:hypothetical protein
LAGVERHDVRRPEEESVTRETRLAEIVPGIVIDGERKVDAVFEILLDRSDRGCLSPECHVEDVHGFSRTDPDSAAQPEFDSRDLDSLDRRSLFEWVFVIHRLHHWLPQSGLRPRIVP